MEGLFSSIAEKLMKPNILLGTWLIISSILGLLVLGSDGGTAPLGYATNSLGFPNDVELFFSEIDSWFALQGPWTSQVGLWMVVLALVVLIVQEPSPIIPSGPAAGTFWVGAFLAYFHFSGWWITGAVLLTAIVTSIFCRLAKNNFEYEGKTTSVWERLTYAFVELGAAAVFVPITVFSVLFFRRTR